VLEEEIPQLAPDDFRRHGGVDCININPCEGKTGSQRSPAQQRICEIEHDVSVGASSELHSVTYLRAALGTSLDNMLTEVDRHLAVGRKLIREKMTAAA
jgi:hypothetical protein